MRALAAGADMALISHTLAAQVAAVAAIAAAVTRGALPMATPTAAAERILALKRAYLSWESATEPPDLAVVGAPEHRDLQARVYARTTTVVRDRDALLPLRLAPTERVLVVARPGGPVTQVVDVGYRHALLVAGIRARHTATVGLTLAPGTADERDTDALEAALAAADLVVVATINAHRDPAQAALVRRTLASGRPVIGLSLGDPYELAAFPELRTSLALYEYSEPALDAAVAVLFGERRATGRLPVTVDAR